jgi:hypothetical protein
MSATLTGSYIFYFLSFIVAKSRYNIITLCNIIIYNMFCIIYYERERRRRRRSEGDGGGGGLGEDKRGERKERLGSGTRQQPNLELQHATPNYLPLESTTHTSSMTSGLVVVGPVKYLKIVLIYYDYNIL